MAIRMFIEVSNDETVETIRVALRFYRDDAIKQIRAYNKQIESADDRERFALVGKRDFWRHRVRLIDNAREDV